MIIKVCGMNEYENIQRVSELDVNWIGFIFYHKSPRGTNGTSLVLPDLLRGENQKRVGVFVNASFEAITDIARVCKLDMIQLHGDETPDDCHRLQKRGYSLIKAFPIATKEDLERTKAYEGRVDYFLFDTKCEGYGGSGKRFDWSVLAEYHGETPFLLSGGIHPGSIGDIRRFQHPRLTGIDLNSGFEIKPGLKDVEALRVFIEGIRFPS